MLNGLEEGKAERKNESNSSRPLQGFHGKVVNFGDSLCSSFYGGPEDHSFIVGKCVVMLCCRVAKVKKLIQPSKLINYPEEISTGHYVLIKLLLWPFQQWLSIEIRMLAEGLFMAVKLLYEFKWYLLLNDQRRL